MSDPLNAAEKAIFDALKDGGLAWPIYQHVPQDTKPPVNIIGDMNASDLGTKGGDDARISLQILTVYQGEQRKPVVDEQALIYDALDEVKLSEEDFEVTCYRTGARAELLEDGETYLGTSTFTVLAIHA